MKHERRRVRLRVQKENSHQPILEPAICSALESQDLVHVHQVEVTKLKYHLCQGTLSSIDFPPLHPHIPPSDTFFSCPVADFHRRYRKTNFFFHQAGPTNSSVGKF